MKTKNVLGAIRRHPGRTLAVCVPLVAVSVFTGTTMASAQPEATLAVSPSAASATPAPYVMNFGGGTPGKTRIVKNKRAVEVREPRNIDGCDHDYGTPGLPVGQTFKDAAGEAQLDHATEMFAYSTDNLAHGGVLPQHPAHWRSLR